jgi:hypothetical protein
MIEPQGQPTGLSSDSQATEAQQYIKRDLTVWDVLAHLKIAEFAKFFGACLAILVGIYSLGASRPFSNEPITPQPIVTKTYHGYYADYKDDGTPTISDETLPIDFLPNNELKVTSTAAVTTKDGRIQKVWKYLGFLKGSRLSMTYTTLSTKEDPTALGVGQFFLEQQNSADYTGTIVYLNCDRGQIMQCPYALTTQNIDASDAIKRWPKLFERTCVALDLSPDGGQHVSVERSCKVARSN